MNFKKLYYVPAIMMTTALAWVPSASLATGTATDTATTVTTPTSFIPESSVEHPANKGLRAHTSMRVVPSPATQTGSKPASSLVRQAAGLPPFGGFYYNTPASLACIAGLAGDAATGCNPNTTSQNNTGVVGTADNGGVNVIAIVDAYDYPTAANDLAVFSSQFGLPAPNFQVVYATGVKPPVDPAGNYYGDWETEEALDIEYAHAMAPNARIVLVEAASNAWTDMFTAVSVASGIVASGGGGEVSMSFGGGEWSGETSYDGYFTTGGVTYIASAGDSAGVLWPSASPYVLSAGGTTIVRNGNGAYTGQMAWVDTGGGPSAYEPRPSDQNGIAGIVGAHKGTPDVSFEADPNTGVWIYNSGYGGNGWPGYGGWSAIGGTSVAAPALAGIINSSSNPIPTSTALAQFYGYASNTQTADITSGSCGVNGTQFYAVGGWDFCTGVGTPSQIYPAACYSCSSGEVNYANASCTGKHIWTFTTSAPNFYNNVKGPACFTQATLNSLALALCEEAFHDTNCVNRANYANGAKTCGAYPPNLQNVVGGFSTLYVDCGHW